MMRMAFVDMMKKDDQMAYCHICAFPYTLPLIAVLSHN